MPNKKIIRFPIQTRVVKKKTFSGDWLIQIMEEDNVKTWPKELHPLFILSGGLTLLHMAAQYNSYNIAKWLIEKGVSIVSVNDHNETPLHSAVKSNSYKVAELIIDSFTDPNDINRKDKTGVTPLNSITENYSLKMLKILINRGADPRSLCDTKIGLLHRIIMHKGDDKHLIDYVLETIKLDVNQKIPKNKFNDDCLEEINPLSIAIENDYEYAVKKLIAKGADVSQRLEVETSKQKFLLNSLQIAIYRNSTDEIMRIILEEFKRLNLDINEADKYGYTALDILVHNYSSSKIKLLKEYGVDFNKHDRKALIRDQEIKISSIHYAIIANNLKFISYVFENNLVDMSKLASEVSLLETCIVQNCNLNIFKLVVQKMKKSGLSIDKLKARIFGAAMIFDNFGLVCSHLQLMLVLAVLNKDKPLNEEFFNVLINEGADINFLDEQSSLVNQVPVLYIALLYDKLDIAELIMRSKGKLEKEMFGMLTSFAIYSSDNENIINAKLALIKRYYPHFKVSINDTNTLGMTALHLMASKYIALLDSESISFLVSKSNVNAQDNDGNTALYYAIEANNISLSKILINSKTCLTLQNNKKYNVLHIAIINNNIPIAKLIIDQDTEAPYQCDVNGDSPIDLIDKNPNLSKNPDLSKTFKQMLSDYLQENVSKALEDILIVKGYEHIFTVKKLTELSQKNNIAFQFEFKSDHKSQFFDSFKTEVIYYKFTNNIKIEGNTITFSNLTKEHRNTIKIFYRQILLSLTNEDKRILEDKEAIQKEQEKAKGTAIKATLNPEHNSNNKKKKKRNKSSNKSNPSIVSTNNNNVPSPPSKESTTARGSSTPLVRSAAFFKPSTQPILITNNNNIDKEIINPYIDLANYFSERISRLLDNPGEPDFIISTGIAFCILFYETKKNISLKIQPDKTQIPAELDAIYSTNFRTWFRHLWHSISEEEAFQFFEELKTHPDIPLSERNLYKILEFKFKDLKEKCGREKLKDIPIALEEYKSLSELILKKLIHFYQMLKSEGSPVDKTDLTIAIINEISNLTEIFKRLSLQDKRSFSMEEVRILINCPDFHFSIGHDPKELFFFNAEKNTYQVKVEIYTQLENYMKEVITVFEGQKMASTLTLN